MPVNTASFHALKRRWFEEVTLVPSLVEKKAIGKLYNAVDNSLLLYNQSYSVASHDRNLRKKLFQVLLIIWESWF